MDLLKATKNLKEGDIIRVKFESVYDNVEYISVYKGTESQYGVIRLLTMADAPVGRKDGEMFFACHEGFYLTDQSRLHSLSPATDEEKTFFYKSVMKEYEIADPNWKKYINDSAWFEIADWISEKFACTTDVEDDNLQVVDDCRSYIWNSVNIDQPVKVEKTPKELVMGWFDHIAQMADDHKNQNGGVMSDYQTFLEIKALALSAREFVNKWYTVHDKDNA